MKKALAILFTVLMVCSMVFAGGSKEADPENLTLRMLWWGGDTRHTPTLAALDKYTERTGISVEGEYAGWDGYYQRIVTQLAGGTAPDLIQIDQPWFNELCSRGDVFAEIDPSIVDTSTFDKAFLDGYCTYEGKLMALPTGVNVNTLVIDKNMLADAGIDPEIQWTWENLISEGKKIHEKDPSKYLLAATPDHVRFWFEVLMAQIAGGVVGPDKELLFTADQAEQAFNYIQALYDNGIIPPYSQTSLFYQRLNEDPNWINGKYAACWSWVSSMDKDIGQRDMETTQFPVMENAVDTGVLMRPSQLYVVASNSASVTESLKLLEYMVNDEEAAAILGTARGIPSSSKALKVLEDANVLSELTVTATNEGIAQAGNPQSTWQMNSEVIDTMQQVIDEFGYGRTTAREAAESMVTSLESTLSRL